MTDTSLERYDAFDTLLFSRPESGILQVVLPGKWPTVSEKMHGDLAAIWKAIDTDPETRVVLLRGEGRGFAAGADLSWSRVSLPILHCG